MYSLDEEKIECALGNMEIWFWGKGKNVVCLISDVGIRDTYLYLTLGTAKIKQLE